MFKRSPAEFPIDSDDVRTIMWLLADIRAELVAIHRLLEDDENGEENT